MVGQRFDYGSRWGPEHLDQRKRIVKDSSDIFFQSLLKGRRKILNIEVTLKKGREYQVIVFLRHPKNKTDHVLKM